MMRLSFIKMESAGNDYVYLDADSGRIPQLDWSRLSKRLSDRHKGIGGDGLILILPSDKADFQMRIFNADGSEGDMCGNGVRCLAGYVWGDGLIAENTFAVQTVDGIVELEVSSRENALWAEAKMTPPQFLRKDIPMTGPGESLCMGDILKVEGFQMPIHAVRVGNPHCIMFVDDLQQIDLETLGPVFESHPVFPEKTNVELASIADRHNINARVFERGTGITQSCGTGACAVAVMAIRRGDCDSPVSVHMPGGCLQVKWDGDENIVLAGPVRETFRGMAYVPDDFKVRRTED